jgi:peptidylprolyl isomerase
VFGLLAGCSSSGSAGTKTETKGSAVDFGPEGKVPTTPAKVKGCRTGADAKKSKTAPEVDAPATAERSLRVADDIPGCGELATKSSTVTVQYVLKARSTGKVVDSSWKGGQPFTTTLGQGQVIPGWDHAIPGMRAGGRRTLLLGPDEGYGATGQPPDIAADDTLVFVIDLLSVGTPTGADGANGTGETTVPTRTAPPPPPIPTTPANAPGCRTPDAAKANTTAPDPAAPTAAETSITVVDDIPGCGDLVGPKSTITARYVLKARSSGKTVDSSWTRGKPFTVPLGQGQIIPGWDDAIPGMRAGGRRTLVLGPAFAYGAAGRPPQVAANDTLLFTIDVLSVK